MRFMYLVKAKKYPVGTVRERKGGRYVKRGEHDWSLLHLLTTKHNEAAGLYHKEYAAKETHRAAKALIREHHDHPNRMDHDFVHGELDQTYSEVKKQNPKGYKTFRDRVRKIFHEYLKTKTKPPIEHEGGDHVTRDYGGVVARHESHSRPGTFHEVRHNPRAKTWTCNCKGWVHHRHCWHSEEAQFLNLTKPIHEKKVTSRSAKGRAGKGVKRIVYKKKRRVAALRD